MIDAVLNVMVGVIAFGLLALCILSPIGVCAYVAVKMKRGAFSGTQHPTSTEDDALFSGEGEV